MVMGLHLRLIAPSFVEKNGMGADIMDMWSGISLRRLQGIGILSDVTDDAVKLGYGLDKTYAAIDNSGGGANSASLALSNGQLDFGRLDSGETAAMAGAPARSAAAIAAACATASTRPRCASSRRTGWRPRAMATT